MNKLANKLKNIAQHIKTTGVKYFLLEKIIGYYYTLKFKHIGVSHSYDKDSYLLNQSNIKFSDAHENHPSSFYLLREGLKATGLSYKNISLLDVGCGDGRVLNFGMLFKFKTVIGIDFNKIATEKAKNNCTKMVQKGANTLFEIHHIDASTYKIPNCINVIYLFNPFGEKTMATVINNIIVQVNNKKVSNPIYVIYCMPSYQQLFSIHPQCKKIYERINKMKSYAEIVVYQITSK